MTIRILTLGLMLVLATACGGGSGAGDDDGDGSGTPGGDPVPDGFPAMSIVETFSTNTNEDANATTADWNNTGVEAGVLRSIPVTSRTATIFGYRFTDTGSNSGRGEYQPEPELLIGQDLGVAQPTLDPAAALGRRVQMAFDGSEIGAAGTITSVEWGPDRNATAGATYPNVRLRMGYQASGSMFLGSTFSGNFDGAATMIYDGAYTVNGSANVGNTPNEPTEGHVGSYPENPGCQAGGTWNKPLFDFTGFYAWPTPTAWFDWDPAYSSGAVMLFDASVSTGDVTQRIRSWRARTHPCSGILIGGFPERQLRSTYEQDTPDPADDFAAGNINPAPRVMDMRFTLTTLRSEGVSLFYEGAFGASNDFGAANILPAAQQDAAAVTVEYQGAEQVLLDRRTIDTNGASTPWTSNVDDCDGFRYIRFRIILRADAGTLAPARVERIVIPLVEAP